MCAPTRFPRPADVSSSPAEQIQQRLRAGDLSAALSECERWLEQAPEEPDALYLLAVIQRYRGQASAARDALEALKRLVPEHGRAHQEEGHLRRSLGDSEGALLAFGRATRYNPALVAAWRAQGELLATLGRTDAAAAVRDRLARIEALPKPLLGAMDLLSQGRLLKAEELCRRFLRAHPRNVDGMRLLADIGARLGVLEDAEFLLESAVAFAPDDLEARIDYVGVLRKRQKFERAMAEAEELLKRAPDDPRMRSLHAIEAMQTGDYDTALAGFDAVLAQVPNDAATLTSRGHALKTCGRAEEAVDAYRAALVAQPRHGEAWYSLANLKTLRFDDADLDAMRAREDDPDLGFMDRVHLAFALGKAHEDRGDHAEAFACYARGNALKKAQSRYDADRMSEEFRHTASVCDADFFAEREGFGDPATDPIFVVGLPRAGSTLIEQILASHSCVDGTLELPDILSTSQRLRRRAGAGPWPEVLRELDADACAELGAGYLRDTRIHRADAPRFTDKMPNNFRHIGLIRLMLPNARIIDARRHPLACCFSGFKQLFAEGQEFSYDLTDLGRYYRDYVELMDHWDTVLPGRVLRVQHEDVVDDLEGQVRRMLDFCELPFEDGCLRYWETERAVRTPSSEQVRKPIFRDAVEQWRNFEPWLAPLKDALGPVLERYPAD